MTAACAACAICILHLNPAKHNGLYGRSMPGTSNFIRMRSCAKITRETPEHIFDARYRNARNVCTVQYMYVRFSDVSFLLKIASITGLYAVYPYLPCVQNQMPTKRNYHRLRSRESKWRFVIVRIVFGRYSRVQVRTPCPISGPYPHWTEFDVEVCAHLNVPREIGYNK